MLTLKMFLKVKANLRNNMVDLKFTEAELKEQKEGQEVMSDGMDNQIPWNLNFSLNDRELKKLGISSKDMKVGSEFNATVTLHVRSMEEHEHEGDEKKGSLGVAVTSMEIASKSSNVERSNKLFGE